MKRRIYILMSLLISLIALSGCARKENIEEEPVSPDAPFIAADPMNDLEDGGFYIKSDDTYQRLYIRDASYEVKETSDTSSTHTLWFTDDWDSIPTMYAGDELIYKTTSDLDESFTLERFEYVGPTIGVSNLQQMQSGRYSYLTDPEELNVNISSSASSLLNLPTSFCIIDRIGGADLRSGNVSNGGCILGLELGKAYLAEVYAGSILHEFKVTADCYALTGMELYETVDYDFMQSQILRINFPTWFHSGYYLLNGYGLVRYVSGIFYDDDTNFNIPNIEPKDTHQIDADGYYIGTMDSDSFPFSVLEASKVTITFTFEDIVRPDMTEEIQEALGIPLCEISGAASIYRLEASPDDDHTLTKTITLMPGNYSLEISNLNDRRFMVDIKIGAERSSTDEQ